MAILNKRFTAKPDKDFVVFLIGMRINNFWRIDKWLPVMLAMPKMLRELYTYKENGFLGAESWFARTIIMVQYWESFEKLEQYARAADKKHYPAWLHFNKKVRQSGAVGVWHETYIIQKGQFETIYVNMPKFGLGKVSELLEARGNRDSAAGRKDS